MFRLDAIIRYFVSWLKSLHCIIIFAHLVSCLMLKYKSLFMYLCIDKICIITEVQRMCGIPNVSHTCNHTASWKFPFTQHTIAQLMIYQYPLHKIMCLPIFCRWKRWSTCVNSRIWIRALPMIHHRSSLVTDWSLHRQAGLLSINSTSCHGGCSRHNTLLWQWRNFGFTLVHHNIRISV
jgi:hypothetical protein